MPMIRLQDIGLAFSSRHCFSGFSVTVDWGQRIDIVGDNGSGSGKSTLARAIYGEFALRRGGDWITPPAEEMAYLDQHYAHLDSRRSVLQTVAACAPDWPERALRHHLSHFLFCGAALSLPVHALSGGERARLSLACIAARSPQLLILDELSNNLDVRARQHVIEVLRDYPCSLLLISHDATFLSAIAAVGRYELDSPG